MQIIMTNKTKQKPGRPRVKHWVHTPTRDERRYYERVLKALKGDPDTRRLYSRMRYCCDPPVPPYYRPYRCRKHFCPSCRFEFRTRWIGKIVLLFMPRPEEFTFLVTLIFDARDHLIDRPDERQDLLAGIFGGTKRQREDRPTDLNRLRQRLRNYRVHLTEALTQKKVGKKSISLTDDLLIEGAFEFEAKTYASVGLNSDQFIEDYRAGRKLPKPQIGSRFFCTHAHFLVCARKDGKYLSQDEIGKLLRVKFPHRWQVRVDQLHSFAGNLKKPGEAQTQSESIAACVGYFSKGFIKDANDDEIRELAIACNELKPGSKRLYRHRGKFKPPSKKAIRAKVAAQRPKPKSGRLMRDGTRAP